MRAVWRKYKQESIFVMLRGCQKRIYYIKNPESKIFDEAYFVLRKNADTTAYTSKPASLEEMEIEAMRIFCDTDNTSNENCIINKKKRFDKVRAFAAGALISSLLIGAITAVVYFFG